MSDSPQKGELVLREAVAMMQWLKDNPGQPGDVVCRRLRLFVDKVHEEVGDGIIQQAMAETMLEMMMVYGMPKDATMQMARDITAGLFVDPPAGKKP